MVAAASTGAILGAAGIGAAGNLFGGVVSNAMQYSSNKKLAKLQAALNYHYAKKSTLNSPSWQREGLTNAGYNPMLAVQHATSAPTSNWTSASGTNAPDLSSIGSDFVSNAQSVQRLENETMTAESQTALNEANQRSAIADSIGKEIHNGYLSEREEKELGKLGAETDKLVRETDFYDALEQNMQKERELQAFGINADYSARIYGANKGYQGVVYNANKLKQIADEHSPSSRSLSFNNYMSGIHHGLSGIGELLPYKFARKMPDPQDFEDTYRTVRDKNETYTKHIRHHK